MNVFFERKIICTNNENQYELRFWHSLKVGITERYVPAGFFPRFSAFVFDSRELRIVKKLIPKNWMKLISSDLQFFFHIYKLFSAFQENRNFFSTLWRAFREFFLFPLAQKMDNFWELKIIWKDTNSG